VPASTICRQCVFGIVGGLLWWNASHTCNNARAICGPKRSPGKNALQVALFSVRHQRLAAAALRLRVRAAFLAEAERSANERDAAAAPPLRPPFFAGALLIF
jgi:hypothetical protein